MRTRRSLRLLDGNDENSGSSTFLNSTTPDSMQVDNGTFSSTQKLILQDTEDSEAIDSSSQLKSNPTSGNVSVVIPLIQDGSSYATSHYFDETPFPTGSNTPATSSSTSTEPTAPRSKVNVADRIRYLSGHQLNSRSTRSRKRASDSDDAALARSLQIEDDDAALAQFLQTEEYNQRPLKKRKTSLRSDLEPGIVSDDSASELSDVPDLESDPDIDDTNLQLELPQIPEQSGMLQLSESWEVQRKNRRKNRDRKLLEQYHPTLQNMWDDSNHTPIAPVAAEQPQSITRKLKSFQLEGLNWMIKQEKTDYKGGLLGDEMGMGKTIQAVSLIMSDHPQPEPTLVLVPPVALMQWVSEIKDYTDGKLNVLVYHNSDPKVKRLKKADLQKFDVIMMSYSSLESMYRKQNKGFVRGTGIVKADSVVHSIHYHRLILDEAHNIKQRTSSVAKACFALEARYRWCLSGTPVQNRIGEFFSLLRFLAVKPHASYFCKNCDCEQMQWTSSAKTGFCTHCNHSSFVHIAIFNREILTPISSGTEDERKKALVKLRFITDRIMLRRLKQDYNSTMELPPKRIIVRREFYAQIEQDFSSSIMTNSTRQFDTYVSRGVMLSNYANIFGLIMQMRQVANHPDLLLRRDAAPINVLVCRVCDEPAEDAIRSTCRHDFCRKCAQDYFDSFEKDVIVDCPQCHIPLSLDMDQPAIEQKSEEFVKKSSIINRINMKDWHSSTKIELLLYELYRQRKKGHTPKSIVFSQFTSMLQLVEWRLRHAGLNTVMLDGSMTPIQRQRSIEYFKNNVDCEVFLVSLKAGGVALNLTEASRVFIVDPWWNPAAEWQSADRSHRIGQHRPCVITRLVIEDSVESRMVQLQEKKANMIRGTLNKDDTSSLEKLTPADMQFLFRGH